MSSMVSLLLPHLLDISLSLILLLAGASWLVKRLTDKAIALGVDRIKHAWTNEANQALETLKAVLAADTQFRTTKFSSLHAHVDDSIRLLYAAVLECTEAWNNVYGAGDRFVQHGEAAKQLTTALRKQVAQLELYFDDDCIELIERTLASIGEVEGSYDGANADPILFDERFARYADRLNDDVKGLKTSFKLLLAPAAPPKQSPLVSP